MANDANHRAKKAERRGTRSAAFLGPSAFALLDLVIIKALFSQLAWPVVFLIIALTFCATPVFHLLATAIIYPLLPL